MIKNLLAARILGATALIFGVAMLAVAAVAFVRDEQSVAAFLAAASPTLVGGLFLQQKGKHSRQRVNMREAAFIILSLWCFLSVLGLFPLLLTGSVGFFDALFMSVSYLTTTGINILPAADYSLYLWCVVLSWLGAVNYLIIFVTLLPQAAGIFGVELSFRRSYGFSPMIGQMKKLAKQTASVFIILTAVGALLYFLAGLAANDAIVAAMLTVSTTGGEDVPFFGASENPWVKTVAVLLLLAVSGNMLRLIRTFRRREFNDLYRHAENKFFLAAIGSIGLVIAFELWAKDHGNAFSALHLALFETLSFLSTACFSAADISTWPDFSKMLLILLMFVGGCMGSPTGGIKMMRIIVLVKMLFAEARRTLHPHMESNVIVDGRSVDFAAVERILAFFFLYLTSFLVFALLLSLGNEQTLAGTVAMAMACFTHGGTGLGLYAADAFAALGAYGKTVCVLFMIVARVEIFSLLVIFYAVFFEQRNKW